MNKSLAKIREMAAIFAALGDETRLQLISNLYQRKPSSIVELSMDKEMSRQAISKHLEVLRSAGIVRSQQEGREKIWHLEDKRLQMAVDYLELVKK